MFFDRKRGIIHYMPFCPAVSRPAAFSLGRSVLFPAEKEGYPMKISTKGRYGLRLMLDLAVHCENGLVPLRDISARQEISEKYLEQIMMLLNRAGLVRSVRGSQGGYALARPAAAITVGDVLRTMEGSLAPVDCVADGASGCAKAERCVTMEVWVKLREAVNQVVDSLTLADLAARYHEKNPPDYCI